MENILKKIITKKKERIVNYKKSISEAHLLNNIKEVKGFIDFKNIKKTISGTRYHSLIIDRNYLGKDLIITAETNDKTIMGVMHKQYNIHGLQFHPESIKTVMGIEILKNFINYKN